MGAPSTPGLTASWRQWLAPALVAIPLACFALNALMWLAYGVDIPFWDDWRAYESGGAGSLDIAYLFKPSNDTLYPVGIFLDSLAHRVLGGNSVAYQLISLVAVLGALLLLQWRLLRSVLGDPLLTACAFAATLFMLQPDSYWGMQNMAYHQAIPVVAVLWALYLVLVAPWRSRLSPVLLLAIGLTAGMTYISGAFAVLATGIALILAAKVLRIGPGVPLLRGGAWLTLAGIATAIPQLWVIVVHQKGTHRADAPMAYPTEPDFWLYLSGKLGRSLMLPMERPVLSLAVVALACAALLVALAWAAKTARSNAAGTRAATEAVVAPVTRAFIILLALGAVVGVYLAIVAAGRTHLRPPNLSPLDIFVTGFHRFHFFWATILWPWLLAAGVLAAQRRSRALATAVAVGCALATVGWCAASGAFRHKEFYEAANGMRIEGIKCIHERLEGSQPIVCGTLLPADLTVALRNAERLDASFSRALELTRAKELPVSEGGNTALPLGNGDVLSGRFPSSDSGSLGSVGILIGTYAGKADGMLSLQACSPRGCSQGSRPLSEAVDNEFIMVELGDPLPVGAAEPITFEISTSGGTHPVAAWIYPGAEGSAEVNTVRRGDSLTTLQGLAVRLKLGYLAY